MVERNDQLRLDSAEWYDRSIDWQARLEREIPLLVDTFGPPRRKSIVDAGCGTGHQAVALAKERYFVMGVDKSDEMLSCAKRHAAAQGVELQLSACDYAEMHATIGADHDGIYCLGNALAASGGREEFRHALRQFSLCLRVGGRLFLQILNFEPMRREVPCVRGPRVTRVDGTEYISVREFTFLDDAARVTNITLYRAGMTWQHHSQSGTLYPATLEEVRAWLAQCSMRIDNVWGGYDRAPYDVERSIDLIIAATRM